MGAATAAGLGAGAGVGAALNAATGAGAATGSGSGATDLGAGGSALITTGAASSTTGLGGRVGMGGAGTAGATGTTTGAWAGGRASDLASWSIFSTEISLRPPRSAFTFGLPYNAQCAGQMEGSQPSSQKVKHHALVPQANRS